MEKSGTKKYSLNCKIAVLIAAWMTMASDMIVTPILGEIVNAFPDASVTWSTMAYNIAGIAFIFSSLFTPKLCQRYTKRNLMLIAAVVAIVTGGFGGIMHNINFIIVMHFIEGLAAGVCTNLIPSFIVDISENENEVIRLNSLNGVIGTVAGFICSTLAGIIAVRFGWQAAYFLFFAGFVVFVWQLIFLPKTPLEKIEEASASTGHMNARSILWAVEVFIFAWLVNMFWTYVATLIDEMSISGGAGVSGMTISLISVTSFIGGFLMIPVTKKLKEYAMLACCAFWIVALLLVLNANSAMMFYIAGLVWGLGQGIAFPYMYTQASLIAEPGTETKTICATTIGWYLAVGVTTLVYTPFMKLFQDESALFAIKFTLGGFVVYTILSIIRATIQTRQNAKTATRTE